MKSLLFVIFLIFLEILKKTKFFSWKKSWNFQGHGIREKQWIGSMQFHLGHWLKAHLFLVSTQPKHPGNYYPGKVWTTLVAKFFCSNLLAWNPVAGDGLGSRVLHQEEVGWTKGLSGWEWCRQMLGSLDTDDSSGLDAKVFAFEGAKNFSYECEFGGMDCQRSKLGKHCNYQLKNTFFTLSWSALELCSAGLDSTRGWSIGRKKTVCMLMYLVPNFPLFQWDRLLWDWSNPCSAP